MADSTHPDRHREIPVLDGVGITPQAEIDPVVPETAVETTIVESPLSQDGAPDRDVQKLFVRAYVLISAALLLSAAVASQVATPDQDGLFMRQAGLQLLIFFEIACVAFLPKYVPKFPTSIVGFLLFFCGAFNGVSFTAFFVWVPPSAVAYGFFVSALIFGATAAISRWRSIELGSWRGLLLLFAVGFTAIPLITFPLGLGPNYWGTAFTGFAVFAILAVYFTDDIRDLDLEFEDDPTGWKSALCGALILYINFINLYLIALRIFAQLQSSLNGRDRRRIY